MQITQRRSDQKWVLLDDNKEVVKEFDSRVEAVEHMKATASVEPQEARCGHGNKGPREAHIIYNPRFSEGSWIAGEGIRDKSGRVISETVRWSEPYLLQVRVGNLCYDCGEIL